MSVTIDAALPCEPCGGRDLRVGMDGVQTALGEQDRYFVACNECQHYGDMALSPESAIFLWNNVRNRAGEDT